jgi:hypothetical protein
MPQAEGGCVAFTSRDEIREVLGEEPAEGEGESPDEKPGACFGFREPW